MTVLYIFLALGYLALAFFAAKEFQNIAIDKGYREDKYFWWSFLFGAAGWAMVIALPNIAGRKTDDPFAALAKLSFLHEEGALSDEEFKKMKADYVKKLGR